MNMNEFTIKPIGRIRCPYTDTKQIPKGLGATHTMEGILDVLPEYAPGLQDIEGFSHLYILWVFDQTQACELTGKTPADERPHGVFATRSPKRPNHIGLTVVELVRLEGNALYLRGIDMLDGTPVIDIKPYLSSIPMDQLRRGWLAEVEKSSGN
jgi:tRNA (adenine37-N6)-methyltransferase